MKLSSKRKRIVALAGILCLVLLLLWCEKQPTQHHTESEPLSHNTVEEAVSLKWDTLPFANPSALCRPSDLIVDNTQTLYVATTGGVFSHRDSIWQKVYRYTNAHTLFATQENALYLLPSFSRMATDICHVSLYQGDKDWHYFRQRIRRGRSERESFIQERTRATYYHPGSDFAIDEVNNYVYSLTRGYGFILFRFDSIKQATPQLLPAQMHQIEVDRHRLYVSSSDSIYTSEDFGEQWRPIELPALPDTTFFVSKLFCRQGKLLAQFKTPILQGSKQRLFLRENNTWHDVTPSIFKEEGSALYIHQVTQQGDIFGLHKRTEDKIQVFEEAVHISDFGKGIYRSLFKRQTTPDLDMFVRGDYISKVFFDKTHQTVYLLMADYTYPKGKDIILQDGKTPSYLPSTAEYRWVKEGNKSVRKLAVKPAHITVILNTHYAL